ncbi:MAG TPA: FAD/NAD(P)-binding oxidoreductase, partial [Candidatus Thermoplasmatota archaeon]|nr:FAD/NAD(P)-binding oxidoreductase [Candidatus Thermoplasmatota archaeon]
MTASILVLGAGFGGIAAATDLARLLPRGHRVTLVDAAPTFTMGLVNLQALDGRTTGADRARPLKALERHGLAFLQARVERVDPASRTVQTSAGALAYDRLVVALGAAVAPERVEGLPPAARNLYALAGARAFHEDLARMRGGGRVLIVAHSMPFKCPPAPYEAAVLAKRFLAARGVDAEVVLATPEPHPLPVFPAETGARLRGLVEERGVVVRNGATLAGFPTDRVAAFSDGSRVAFDALGLVPPHVPPAGLAGLADGWLAADPATLATAHPDVWAVGDCAGVKLANGKMLPKAGVLAEAQGRVVAANLAAAARGETPA